jgi:hypothetical protein
MRLPPLLLPLLLLSQPAPALEVTSGSTPQHAVFADFDGDGWADFAAANAFGDSVAIHLQDGAGMFPIHQSVSVGINPAHPSNFPRFLQVTDINRDGFPDLIVICSGQFSLGAEPSVQSLLNDGTGTFYRMPATETTTGFFSEEFPVQFAEGEFNGDGYPDLAVCNLEGKSVRLLSGSGTGIYELGQELAIEFAGEGPQDLAVFDQDEDGLDDLWMVSSKGFLVVRQMASGVFSAPTPIPLAEGTIDLRAISLEDFDGDGVMDAALADAEGRVHLVASVDVLGGSQGVTPLAADSLSGCSDVAAAIWDEDWIPDIAVTNRTGNSVTLFLSSGGNETFPTGGRPRRVEANGDFNGDGRNDLIVANEGDTADSGNPDITLIPNAHEPPSNVDLQFQSEIPLAPHAANSVSAPRGLSVGDSEEGFWVLDGDRTSLVVFDPLGAVSARLEFPFLIGGFHLTDEEEGYVVEKDAPRIHEFEIHSENGGAIDLEIELAATFATLPGETGFSGLAYDEDLKEFFVSDPGRLSILRISEEGSILAEIECLHPAWDLTWNSSTSRLLAVNPGRSQWEAYTRTGAYDAGASFDWATVADYFKSSGLAGISWSEEGNRLFLVGTGGVFFEDLAGNVTGAVPILFPGEIPGMDFSGMREELAVLSGSGFCQLLSGEDFEIRSSFSLWPAMIAHPNFIPAGVAFEEDLDEILVCDRETPLAARFNRQGAFLGMRDFLSDVGAIKGPLLGFDYPETESYACFRTRNHLRFGPPALVEPIGASNYAGLSWLSEGIFFPGRNPGELSYLSSLTGPSTQRIAVDGLAQPFSFSGGPAGLLYFVNGGNQPTLNIQRIITQSMNEHWAYYE